MGKRGQQQRTPEENTRLKERISVYGQAYFEAHGRPPTCRQTGHAMNITISSAGYLIAQLRDEGRFPAFKYRLPSGAYADFWSKATFWQQVVRATYPTRYPARPRA